MFKHPNRIHYLLTSKPFRHENVPQKRNEKCKCGSGIKVKRCYHPKKD